MGCHPVKRVDQTAVDADGVTADMDDHELHASEKIRSNVALKSPCLTAHMAESILRG